MPRFARDMDIRGMKLICFALEIEALKRLQCVILDPEEPLLALSCETACH
jgi:hypothetical protein